MNACNILIVEDEKEIADTLQYALSAEGHQPIWASSGQAAKEALSSGEIDFCVLDVGLPDYNGFELLREIRLDGLNKTLPILMLTARSEEIDRVVGLELGADDYVCKPFSPRELVARIRAILKRVQAPASQSVVARTKGAQINKFGDFGLNSSTRTISYRQDALTLTRSEYQLLSEFLEQPNRVFSRRQLIEAVWSSNHPSDDRVIDTHVKSLRAKLRHHNPHKEFIKTHRGFGYSFDYE